MFSGIVEEVAKVVSLTSKGSGVQLKISSTLDHHATALGDSIAVNGVCLTVVSKNEGFLAFDLAEETLRRSTLGELKAGSRVNLERSLQVGQRISGHFVFGHVDGKLKLAARSSEAGSEKYTWEFSAEYAPYIAEKGSIAIAGVSLTVGQVKNNCFDVYLIPHTLQQTNLADFQIGAAVNMEVDMLARYVVNALKSVENCSSGSKLDLDFLKQHGYSQS